MTNREIVRFDTEHLECKPWGNEEATAVKTSLRLCDTGERGSKIIWSSSNPSVITNFGRIVRPRWGESPVCVTMTASVSHADASVIKTFSFTVLPDEPFTDPEYESDQSFFQRLDDTKEELKQIRSAAERGELNEAKKELLRYQRRKKRHRPDYRKTLSRPTPGMCRMMVSGVSTLQRCDRFYMGSAGVRSCAYEKQTIALQTGELKNGMTITYDVCALYNEAVGVAIAGNAFETAGMRPVLEVITKTGTKRFDCIDNATIGAGKNTDRALNFQEELQVRLFGKFWGDGTYHSLFKFQIDGMDSEITGASLILYAKKDMALDGTKELLVLLFPENIWDCASAKWSRFQWQFANRNGLPQPDLWEEEPGFDFEYLFQRVRFMHFPWLMEEYRRSGNEEIPYSIIKTMTGFIRAQGMPRTYGAGHEHIGSAWRDDTTSQTLCGGWPRGLDAAERLDSFSNVFGELVKSRYMTSDACAAILKYVWDACDALAFKSLTKPVTNLRQFEVMDLLNAAAVFDEFKQQPEWIKTVNETMEQMIFSVTLEDGTYMETTGGYNESVCQNFVQFKKLCMENGVLQSVPFDERLKRFARYNALLQGPNGESIQYGDSCAGTSEGVLYPELTGWFADEELTFLLTRGARGSRPEWTSCRFPASGVTVLRSGWERDATYLFTQARGGGAHGHQDDNHIALIAGGRILLTDAGIFTYCDDDPYRTWGKSPLAHNTICINDLNQAYGKGTGVCHELVTDACCDIVSQSTNRYEGYAYTRKIEFIKPALFLITDTVVPDDMDKENDYKQPWHMLPTANLAFDYENNCMRSRFAEGANLLIRSLDDAAELKREMGWYDYGYQQLSENPFGYYERKGVKGSVTFHTLLQIID